MGDEQLSQMLAAVGHGKGVEGVEGERDLSSGDGRMRSLVSPLPSQEIPPRGTSMAASAPTRGTSFGSTRPVPSSKSRPKRVCREQRRQRPKDRESSSEPQVRQRSSPLRRGTASPIARP